MSDNIFFVVELALEPGQADELRAVASEMVDLARQNEPGTLNYEYFITDDGRVCHIYERYADAAAYMAHSASFPESLSQRGRAFRPTRLSAYGRLSDEILRQRIDPVRRAVPGLAPVLLEPLSGFARTAASEASANPPRG